MLGNRRYNKGTSTMESLIATIVILLIIFGVVALFMPDNPKCIEPGCDRNQAENSSYCYLHKPVYYSGSSNGKTSGYQSGSSVSNYSGTGSIEDSESDICHHGSCEKKVISGSRYCSSHTCGKGRNGCYREVPGANELCSSCKEKRKNSASNDSTSSTRSNSYNTQKKTSSSKDYDMPDCDDYESYDDFMDDWDGDMPDGSDAEDYWEDW